MGESNLLRAIARKSSDPITVAERVMRKRAEKFLRKGKIPL